MTRSIVLFVAFLVVACGAPTVRTSGSEGALSLAAQAGSQLQLSSRYRYIDALVAGSAPLEATARWTPGPLDTTLSWTRMHVGDQRNLLGDVAFVGADLAWARVRSRVFTDVVNGELARNELGGAFGVTPVLHGIPMTASLDWRLQRPGPVYEWRESQRSWRVGLSIPLR
jgi:hypothetical protein